VRPLGLERLREVEFDLSISHKTSSNIINNYIKFIHRKLIENSGAFDNDYDEKFQKSLL
jgi:hypothetical protein